MTEFNPKDRSSPNRQFFISVTRILSVAVKELLIIMTD
jgi:hypothetical protein